VLPLELDSRNSLVSEPDAMLPACGPFIDDDPGAFFLGFLERKGLTREFQIVERDIESLLEDRINIVGPLV
jgi:hypothetical protein